MRPFLIESAKIENVFSKTQEMSIHQKPIGNYWFTITIILNCSILQLSCYQYLLKCRVHCDDLLNCGDVNAESVRSRLTVPGWFPAHHTAVTYDHQTNIRNYTDQWMIETVQSSDNWFVSLSSFIICFSVVMMERWCPGLETQVGNVQWVWTVWDQWYWERRWLSVRHSSATLSQCCGCVPGKESSQQSIASERNLDRIWTQDWTGSLSHLSLRSWFHRVVVSSEQLLHYNTHLPLSSCHLTRE